MVAWSVIRRTEIYALAWPVPGQTRRQHIPR